MGRGVRKKEQLPPPPPTSRATRRTRKRRLACCSLQLHRKNALTFLISMMVGNCLGRLCLVSTSSPDVSGTSSELCSPSAWCSLSWRGVRWNMWKKCHSSMNRLNTVGDLGPGLVELEVLLEASMPDLVVVTV